MRPDRSPCSRCRRARSSPRNPASACHRRARPWRAPPGIHARSGGFPSWAPPSPRPRVEWRARRRSGRNALGRARTMAMTKARHAAPDGRGTRRSTASGETLAVASPWITSAPFDLVLFVATPLLILPLILLSLRFAGPSQLYLYVAAFGALG